MYAERPSRLPGGVVWRSVRAGPGSVLPDGCMDLLWMGGAVVVAGPDTEPYHVGVEPGDSAEHEVSGLRFPPGALPGLLGVPASAVRDERVPLAELLSAPGLADTLAAAEDPLGVLEEFALRRTEIDPRTTRITELLRGGAAVTDVADQVNLGVRALHRWCVRSFGYGPKTLARILRFQRALTLAGRTGFDADIAAEAGYADQAHLIRETRAFAGTSFGALRRELNPS